MTSQVNSKNNGTSIDRSRVKILLCDRNAESCEEVSTLLTACCYQVISVGSAVKVVDALNEEWSSIDIILAAVDLPIESSIEMLKYIMQDRHFKCIPVIMLSTNHESSFLLNFLRLGATDYLVKPLCIDEILNLWMHCWRQPKELDWLPQNNLQISSEDSSNIFVYNDTDEEFLENTMQTLCVSKRN
ncbi:two-component response regulator-like APRR1 isoform X1 [Rosa rugosa]|uniref:two-component response regulator-like APRR1 isoform X1 n=1 Tax=Rosa rugosa TaxID=74645 RepID=UPI002B40266A|nr:two-component response regulator-like APRR1 isoform X1 [Rosa rugosa]